MPPAGAGNSCCAETGFEVALLTLGLFMGRWKNSSLSGASGPGESGSGLGTLFPLLSASVADACDLPDAAEATLSVGSSGEPGSSYRSFSGDAPLRVGSGYWR